MKDEKNALQHAVLKKQNLDENTLNSKIFCKYLCQDFLHAIICRTFQKNLKLYRKIRRQMKIFPNKLTKIKFYFLTVPESKNRCNSIVSKNISGMAN